MNCTEFERQIDEFVDGLTDARSRECAERHLAGCPDCRCSVDELRALLLEAAALPREIDPPRDLYPSIRRSLDFASRETLPGPGRRWMVWGGLAASLLLVLTAAVIGLGRWTNGRAPVTPSATEPTVLTAGHDSRAEFRAAEQEYLRATQLLLASLEENRAELSPETATVIEENLAIIDRAIEEVRVALADDPESRRNGQVLTALHRQKLQLLLRASRLSS